MSNLTGSNHRTERASSVHDSRVLADGRTKITVADIEAIRDSVLAEVQSIRGERAGTSLPGSFNEALALIADLKAENTRLRGEAA